MMSPLVFLLKLAWDCRYRIPLIITIGFMVLDIRMQFELNIQTRRVRRRVNSQNILPVENRPGGPAAPLNPATGGPVRDETTTDSWSTLEEDMGVENTHTEGEMSPLPEAGPSQRNMTITETSESEVSRVDLIRLPHMGAILEDATLNGFSLES